MPVPTAPPQGQSPVRQMRRWDSSRSDRTLLLIGAYSRGGGIQFSQAFRLLRISSRRVASVSFPRVRRGVRRRALCGIVGELSAPIYQRSQRNHKCFEGGEAHAAKTKYADISSCIDYFGAQLSMHRWICAGIALMSVHCRGMVCALELDRSMRCTK